MGNLTCKGCGTDFNRRSEAEEHVEQAPPAHFLEDEGDAE